jgi:hypothetical protein
MKRRAGFRTATPVGWAVGCGSLVACSTIFGIDEPAQPGGSSGAGAEGGSTSMGGARGGTAQSGRSGKDGDGSGGDSGSSGNASGGATGSAGGEGGAGGEMDRGAILGESCTLGETLGNRACTSASRQLVLQCRARDGGLPVWEVYETCDSYEVCVPGDADVRAQCEELSDDCAASYTSVCTGANRLLDCETRRPEATYRYCPFKCEGGACLPGVGDQLIVHTRDVPLTGTATRTIPVCVLDAVRDDDVLVEWIRDEVERTWARTVDYEFVDWAACDERLPETGVILSFASDCRGRLVNDFENGSPARVEICRSFFDAAGDLHLAQDEEALVRFLTRHQFGHVIGVGDTDFHSRERTTMVRGIELDRIAEYGISALEQAASRAYCSLSCRKHPGALVTVLGRCLEVTPDGIVPSSCVSDESNSTTQNFTLRSSELLSLDQGRCVGVSDESILVDECGIQSERFAFRAARWSSFGRCVMPAALPVSPGTAVVMGACEPVGDSTQAWTFDVFDANADGLSARIRFGDDCVTVPVAAPDPNTVLELHPCAAQGSSEQTFVLRHTGEIGYGEVCFDWELADGSVVLRSTCASSARWLLTGALSTLSGRALTLRLDEGRVTVSALLGLPTEEQTFDFYF